MAWMENHLDGVGSGPEPQPEPRHKLSARDLVLGTIVAGLFAAAAIAAAILSFDLNPAGPVIVVVAAIAAGSLAVRRVHDTALKAAAIGLVIGGIVAILFWPFFDV